MVMDVNMVCGSSIAVLLGFQMNSSCNCNNDDGNDESPHLCFMCLNVSAPCTIQQILWSYSEIIIMSSGTNSLPLYDCRTLKLNRNLEHSCCGFPRTLTYGNSPLYDIAPCFGI